MQSNTNADLPEIPDGFSQYADEIKATAKDTVSFKLKPATNMTLWQSKVGGEPYLPLKEQYPVNGEGKPLMLLLQINFSEMPHLSGYPEKGILEFYIDGHDDLMGMSFEDRTEQDKFRVLYFENVVEDLTTLHQDTGKYQKDPSSFPLEGGKTYSIEFRLEKQYITRGDYRFALSFREDYDLIDQYAEAIAGREAKHRVGGYPEFTQSDPREDGAFRGYELLVQLDTDSRDGVSIMWGDAGIGAFFIKPSDLKERDFTRVAYNWDCS